MLKLAIPAQAEELESLEWGRNTNIDAVFELILDRALDSNVPEEQMIQTLFIFNDMQLMHVVGQKIVPHHFHLIQVITLGSPISRLLRPNSRHMDTSCPKWCFGTCGDKTTTKLPQYL